MWHFNKNWILKIALCLLCVLFCASCATIGRQWKALVGGKSDPPPNDPSKNPAMASFSNTQEVVPAKERKYHRVTVDNFGDQQGLDDNAGSLWRKEGQGSYLFSQNSLRNIGDIINVEMDGKAAENLNAKLTIIKQALIRSEPAVVVKRSVAEAIATIPKADGKTQPGQTTAANGQPGPTGAQDTAMTDEEKAREAREPVNQRFDDVPCRITETNPDGSYRVKGASPVFIGRHEYRLIVTGVVRPEDLSYEDAITSSKIMDSKFDLVATSKEVK